MGTVLLAVTAGVSLTRFTIVWGATGTAESREALYALLRPVALSNCQLQRFGETHDGGYLMCANLLEGVQSGYSYGISGYDQWGCDISTRHNVPVHQYRLLQHHCARVPDRPHQLPRGVRGEHHAR